MKVLISAYACEPGKGSEPAVGWRTVREMAKYHDVWVITRRSNRAAIDRAMAQEPTPSLHFSFYDLPRWATFWKKGNRGVQIYYYLWQIGVFFIGWRLHQRLRFSLIHHVTFCKYWAPSFLSFLPLPFVFGPVGGGETTPRGLRAGLGFKGRMHDTLRVVARWIGEHDPFVRLTVRRSCIALASTEETAERLRLMGANDVRVLSQVGLGEDEIEHLSKLDLASSGPFRFVAIGRLVPLKGFDLALKSFARAQLQEAEFWVLGDGPQRAELESLVDQIGIRSQVQFFGQLSRSSTFEKLGRAHVLVHPSMHESGGYVCLEAIAAGRPVICLDVGGPSLQVTDASGVKILPCSPAQVINDISDAMNRLYHSRLELFRISTAGRARITAEFSWNQKGKILAGIYQQCQRRDD